MAETDIKKWDGSVINMMNKALPNYDKSLESYDTESINIDSLNEWGGSIV